MSTNQNLPHTPTPTQDPYAITAELDFLTRQMIPNLEHLLATARRRFAALSMMQEAIDRAREVRR